MTKRLIAIVMAALLAITMFTFPAFADSTVQISKNETNKSLTISWDKVADAANYVVDVYKDGARVGGSTVSASAASLSYTYTYGSAGGVFTAQVTAKAKSGVTITFMNSNSVNIPITSSSSTMTVTSDGTVVASWKEQAGVSSYCVEYTYKENGTTKNGSAETSSTSYTFANISYANLVSVKVYIGTVSSHQASTIASWTNSTTPGTTTANGSASVLTQNGININVNSGVNNYAIVTWNAVAGASYYKIGYNTSGTATYTWSGNIATTSASVPMAPNAITNIIVVAYLANGTQTTVGNGTVYGNTTAGGTTTTSGITVVSKTATTTTISWNAVSNAIQYLITYKTTGSTQEFTGATSATTFDVPFGSSAYFTVAVTAITTAGTMPVVGTATITPNGITNGNGTTGTTTTNNTVQGYNCTATITATNATVTWNGNAVMVIYTISGQNDQYGTPYGNSAVIPTNGKAANVMVIDATNNLLASVTIPAYSTSGNTTILPGNNGTTNITASEVVNLTATKIDANNTLISWDKVANARSYTVSYGPLNSNVTVDKVITTNSISIPYNASKSYQVFVYYRDTAGKLNKVGHIYNVPGAAVTTNPTPATPSTTTPSYPSTFKAVSGDKKITLSWNAAAGATKYTVKYKKPAATEWKTLKTTDKKALVVTVSNNVEYEFKVVPNVGIESGILKTAASTSSKTVVAKDPVVDDDGDVIINDTPVATKLELTSVSSTATGKITAEWTDVGAPSYRVYVAQGNSGSYKYCGTFTGTKGTITTLGTGSSAVSLVSGTKYKVRVVRSDYSGDISSALVACPYVQVTVK